MNQALEKLRKEKDAKDLELLSTLCERIFIVQRIWALKKLHEIPLEDEAEESAMMKRVVNAGTWLVPMSVVRFFMSAVVRVCKLVAYRE